MTQLVMMQYMRLEQQMRQRSQTPKQWENEPGVDELNCS
jgi:hypothetical protein